MFKERIIKIYHYRHALWDMAINQLKAKYAGSKLGLWWALIIPLLLAASINFVFTKVFKIETANYTFFVLAGIIPWFFFSNSLVEATDSFITRASLLKQAIIPREFIPISPIIANFLNFIIGLLFLLTFFIILNLKVIALLPILFLVTILLLLFIVGLGLLFSCANVYYRDLSHFLSIAFMIWFWVTPIFYSTDNLESPFRTICFLNPMSYYVVLFQAVLFQAKFPDPFLILVAFLIASASFILGYIVFIKQEPRLLKRI